ncbi:fimbrial protein [Porphyromonas levii]|uniref:fimbrial tip adhesin FimD n=1 Tax=Porphyromonas levii TaxID=28114 RepID=UPI001B8D2AA9|nr:fimbrial protein [Porphyromonas levii]MBR8713568.1 hypothetical protein [Porphyromonas levii]MBR8715613.1 hypothetical protein [Porphyromonas levii]MBR8728127.1 hypothetical protein [Porphyromonas levii]MBR8736514.1 hypothetical protein [Porphyromonas levii]MBR8778493.1 hypothetical protein [Porphyromonas levii]
MNKIKNILYFGLALLMMASCTNQRDELDSTNSTTGEGYLLELPLSIRNATPSEAGVLRASDTGVALRGVGTEPGDQDQSLYDSNILNENKIDNLNIFIFDALGNLIKSYKDGEIVKPTNTTSTTDGTYKVTLRVAKTDVVKIENKSVKIIAIANAEGDIVSRVTTIAQLQAKHEQYDDLNTKEKARANFLMDGMLQLSNISWGTKESYSVPEKMELKRALAKIRLRVGVDQINVRDLQNGIETPYKVVEIGDRPDISVKLMRYTNATSLVAGAPYAQQWVAETDYRAMPKRNFPANLFPTRNGDFYASYPFYAGESNWVDASATTFKGNSKDETYLMLRIKLIPEKANDGDPGKYYYYKLPINYRKSMDGVSDERLHKIERNYLYDVVTSIEQLGSLDEGTPLEVKSHIAIQPWPVADIVDGTVTQAHYLVVKELKPIMANVKEYAIGYISDLPVVVKITEAFYEYYDQRGDYYKVVFDPNSNSYSFWWYGLKGGTTLTEMTEEEITKQGLTKPTARGNADGATVVPTNNYIKDGLLNVSHAIPVNFVPFQIKFTVTQEDSNNTKLLSESVHVTQYPPLFVTGRKSPGFAGGTSQVKNSSGQLVDTYADFRYYSTLGMPGNYGGSGTIEAQRNDVFNRITTKVPGKIDLGGGQTLDYSVGNPFDETTQMTVKEDWAQNIVSPEFIIATQHGMTNNDTPQYGTSMPDMSDKSNHTYSNREYVTPYGPSSTYFDDKQPYQTPQQYGGTPPTTNQQMYARAYSTAGNRCYNYFEGEYGMDGKYGEYYWDRETNSYQWRVIYKTFKYKGRWRVPTIAEARLIDAIQDNPNSVTKRLMYGRSYWTAKTGTAYGFTTNTVLTGNDVYQDLNGKRNYQVSPVRCIFDTYMHNDDKGLK